MAPAGSKLAKLEAWYVADDGTLDLGAAGYGPSVTFEFELPPLPKPSADPSLPVGVTPPIMVTLERRINCVQIDREGFHPLSSFAVTTHGAVPKPTCSTPSNGSARTASSPPYVPTSA
jgi:hypothetical protein